MTAATESSAGLTSALHAQWRALQWRKRLVERYLDDVQAALSASQQRSADYTRLQSRHSSTTASTVPWHHETVRRMFDAVERMSPAGVGEAKEGSGQDGESAAAVLSYAAVIAALRRHQRRWAAKEADLKRAHLQLQLRQADVSVDSSLTPTSASWLLRLTLAL